MGEGQQITRDKITRLVAEIRSWGLTDTLLSVQELAAKFDLDPLTVDRIARSEGYLLPLSGGGKMKVSDGAPDRVDEDAITQPIAVDKE